MHKIIELTEQKGYGKPERYSEKLEACSDLHNEITIPRDGSYCPCLTYTIKGEELLYQSLIELAHRGKTSKSED